MRLTKPNSNIRIQRLSIQRVYSILRYLLVLYHSVDVILVQCRKSEIVNEADCGNENFLLFLPFLLLLQANKMCLSLYFIFFSKQNPTLGTATVLYKPSKMSPASTCHYRSRRVGEVGCFCSLQEWKTTFSSSSKMERYR